MPVSHLRPAVSLEMAPGDILVLLSDGFYEYGDASGAQFGEERVQALVADHCERPMAELLDILVRAVGTFAGGAPQEDDMTAVLVRREVRP